MTRRKDGLWQEYVLEDGKRKYFYGKTKADVFRKVIAYKKRANRTLTVSDVLDAWYEWKAPTVAYKTAEGYKAPIERIKTYLGDLPLPDVTPDRIQAMIDDIAARGFKRTTVQRPLDVLRMAFDFAITRPNAVVAENPCRSVRLPAGLKQATRGLAPRDAIQKIHESAHLPFALFPMLMMYAGLRDGEALALTRDDIKNDVIIVNKSLLWKSNVPVIKAPKTAAGVRTVALLEPIRRLLPPEWKGFLFSDDGGKTPLTQTRFRLRWRAFCRESGIATKSVTVCQSSKRDRLYTKTKWSYPLTPYQLRHEFASICLDAGLVPKDVQDLMGHASPDTAQRIYAHITESRREKTHRRLEAFVKDRSI